MSELEHKVKHAVEVRVGRARFYVAECICGWSSSLHTSPSLANAAYAEHKSGLRSADFLPAFADRGTREVTG